MQVLQVNLLKFDSFFFVEDFCLLKESKKILFSTPLFYSCQNPVVHWVALTSKSNNNKHQ
jgi:hypothetical protein